MSGLLGGITNAAGAVVQGQNQANQARLQSALQQASIVKQQQQEQIANAVREREANSGLLKDRLVQAQIGDTQAQMQQRLLPPKPVAKKYQYITGPDGSVSAVNEADPTDIVPHLQGVQGKVENVPQHNIDPLSKAGIRAQIELAKGKPKSGAARPTETQIRAGLVYPRAAQAAKNLDKYYDSGAPATSAASKIPIIGNYMLSDDEQAMTQAAETVASSILRLESGAAISDSEVKSYAKQFLPQPGDGPDVLAQKRATLHTQLQRMQSVAAPAMGDAGDNGEDADGGSQPTEQQAHYDAAAAVLKARGLDPVSQLGPRP